MGRQARLAVVVLGGDDDPSKMLVRFLKKEGERIVSTYWKLRHGNDAWLPLQLLTCPARA